MGMLVDVFASAAAKKYNLTEPDILGLIDLILIGTPYL